VKATSSPHEHQVTASVPGLPIGSAPLEAGGESACGVPRAPLGSAHADPGSLGPGCAGAGAHWRRSTSGSHCAATSSRGPHSPTLRSQLQHLQQRRCLQTRVPQAPQQPGAPAEGQGSGAQSTATGTASATASDAAGAGLKKSPKSLLDVDFTLLASSPSLTVFHTTNAPLYKVSLSRNSTVLSSQMLLLVLIVVTAESHQHSRAIV